MLLYLTTSNGDDFHRLILFSPMLICMAVMIVMVAENGVLQF